MNLRTWLIVIAAFIATGALLYFAGHTIGKSSGAAATKASVPLAAARQSDGSLVLERKPVAKAKPAQKLPSGAKVQRVGSLTIQPKAADKDCPPLTAHWTQYLDDMGEHIVTSSPDGVVIRGLDTPVSIAATSNHALWSVGVVTNFSRDRFGIYVDRDLWRVRTGLQVTQAEDRGVEAWAKLGFNF